MTDLAALTADDFDRLVGADFALVDRPEHPALTLTAVSRSGRRTELREGFALLFTGAGQQVMPQDVYALRHAELDELAIFLVPVGIDAEGVRYEAVFS